MVGDLLTCHVRILVQPNASSSDLIDSYASLGREAQKKNNGNNLKLQDQDSIFNCFKRDISKGDLDLSQGVLHCISQLITTKSVKSLFSDRRMNDMLMLLLETLSTSNDRSICWKGLNCLSKNELPLYLLKDKISQILTVTERIITSKLLSSRIIEVEALEVISMLLNGFPAEMEENVESWVTMVYPFLASDVTQVAELALHILNQNITMLCNKQDVVHKYLITDLTKGLLQQLKDKFQRNREIFTLDAWACLVSLLGHTMHKGDAVTNELLKFTEKGFKSQSKEVVAHTFKVWKSLIKNYTSTLALHTSSKRLRLLLMPLLSPISKVRHEKVELARFSTWWYLICSLNEGINACFEEVVLPFLNFCFKVEGAPSGVTSGSTTPSKNLTNENNRTPASPSVILMYTERTPRTGAAKSSKLFFNFKEITVRGAEGLLLLLGGPVETHDCSPLDKYQCNIEHFSSGSIRTDVFRSHCSFIFAAMQEVSGSSHVRDLLLSNLWSAVVLITRRCLEEGKSDANSACVGGLILLLEKVFERSRRPASLLMKMAFHFFHELQEHLSPYKEGLRTEDNPYGLLSVALLQLLPKATISDYVLPAQEKFLALWQEMVRSTLAGLIDPLLYLNSLFQCVQQSLRPIADYEFLYRIWNIVTNNLERYISETSEVNQGDSLVYDYSCIVEVLTFPFRCFHFDKLSEETIRALLKDFVLIYKGFKIAADLVPSAKPNSAAEELSKSIHNLLTLEDGCQHKTGRLLRTLLECLIHVTKGSRYGSLEVPTYMVSPRKLSKNLLSDEDDVIYLYKLNCLVLQVALQKNDLDQRGHDSLVLQGLDVVDATFDTIHSQRLFRSFLTDFVPIMVSIYKLEGKPKDTQESQSPDCSRSKEWITSSVDGKRVLSTKIFNKACSVMEHFYGAAEKIFINAFDDELLQKMKILLEAAFRSDNKKLKSGTMKFWNVTFGRSRAQLSSADSSLTILSALSEKARPSQMLKDEELALFPDSQSLITNITSSPKLKDLVNPHQSPHKVRGSFLHLLGNAINDGKPEIKKDPLSSPSKSPSIPRLLNSPKTAKKNIVTIDETSSSEFVKIDSPPKKKRIWTEHQKEVMLSKRVIPILYNDLDMSQDTNIFSTMSQDNSQKSPTESTGVNQSLFIDEEPRDLIHLNAKGGIPAVSAIESNFKQAAASTYSRDLSREYSTKIVNSGEFSNVDLPQGIKTASACKSSSTLRTVAEIAGNKQPQTTSEPNKEMLAQDIDTSPDVIPSTQTDEDTNRESNNDLTKYSLCQLGKRTEQELTTEQKNEDATSSTGHASNVSRCIKAGDKDQPQAINWGRVLVEETQAYSLSPPQSPVTVQSNSVDCDPENLTTARTMEESTEAIDESKGSIIFDSKDRVRESSSQSSTLNGNRLLVEGKEKDKVVVEKDSFAQPISRRTRRKSLKVSKGRGRKRLSPLSGNKKKGVKSPVRFVENVTINSGKLKPCVVEDDVEDQESINSKKSGQLTPMHSDMAKKRRRRRSTHFYRKKKSRISNPIQFEVSTVEEPEEVRKGEDKSSDTVDNVVEGIESDREQELDKGQDIEARDFCRKSEETQDDENDTTRAKGKQSDVSPPKSKDVLTAFHLLAINGRTLGSPGQSPVSGILKKRTAGKVDSPSPPNKTRRVSFALPLESNDGILHDDDIELARPIIYNETQERSGKPVKQYTAIKPKGIKAQASGPAIFPDLVSCTAPIEQILPTLTPFSLSRGLGHVVRAQNILTVGNLSALSEDQIQNLPIRSPKVRVVKEALRHYASQSKRAVRKVTQERDSCQAKGKDDKRKDSEKELCTTPPKIPLPELEESVLPTLSTPSRSMKEPRPTSLFQATIKVTSNSDQNTVTVDPPENAVLCHQEANDPKDILCVDEESTCDLARSDLNCSENKLDDFEDGVNTQESNSPLPEDGGGEELSGVDYCLKIDGSGSPRTEIETTDDQDVVECAVQENCPARTLRSNVEELRNSGRDKLLNASLQDLFALQESLCVLSSELVAVIKGKSLSGP